MPRGKVDLVRLENGEVWQLNGECNRCGQCCEDMYIDVPEFDNGNHRCNKLRYEKVNGERLAACDIVWNRPAGCLLYPRDPYDKLPEKCSFEWEKISG
jgi:hypothetical protein